MVLTWEPIADLPEDWRSLSDRELGPLLQFWNDQRADLERNASLAIFSQRLSREWSIETGQIEGVYDIDRGVAQTLIDRGINADLIPAHPGQKPPEVIAAIIQDHIDVLEGLFQFVRGERPLSKGYIHELHAALLRHQETTVVMDQFGNLFDSKLVKGAYKERPNNSKRSDGTLHQYSPPEQVDPEMERLLALHTEHTSLGVPVEIEAAWFHHRFTQIHPYQDGNGRVARALASVIFIKAGWFPVVVTRDDRVRYIEALEVADQGDLRRLITFFADVQKRAVFQAAEAAAADVKEVGTIGEAIDAAKRVLSSRTADPNRKVKNIADRLMEIAIERLQQVADSLHQQIGPQHSRFRFELAIPVFPTRVQLPYEASSAYQRVHSLVLHGRDHRFIEIRAMRSDRSFVDSLELW